MDKAPSANLPPGSIAEIDDDGNVVSCVTREVLVCDFCSQPNPGWRFPADSLLHGPAGLSVGGWAACEACAALVHTRQWEQLARRVLDTPMGEVMKQMVGEQEATNAMLALYRELQRHLRGTGIRLDPVN